MVWAHGKHNCDMCGKEVWNDSRCSRCKRFMKMGEGVKKLDKFSGG